jgi:hypothetical protein
LLTALVRADVVLTVVEHEELGTGVGVAVGAGVGTAVGTGVAVAVGAGVGVDLAVGTGVAVAVGVGGGGVEVTEPPVTNAEMGLS